MSFNIYFRFRLVAFAVAVVALALFSFAAVTFMLITSLVAYVIQVLQMEPRNGSSNRTRPTTTTSTTTITNNTHFVALYILHSWIPFTLSILAAFIIVVGD